MKAARDLVPATTELASCMKLRQDDFEGRLAALVHVDRDAAPVVEHGHRAVLVDSYVDFRSEASHRLVDRVVDNLVHALMKAANGRAPDVHAGALPDSFQAFQDLNLGGIIFLYLCHKHHSFSILSRGLDVPCMFILSPTGIGFRKPAKE